MKTYLEYHKDVGNSCVDQIIFFRCINKLQKPTISFVKFVHLLSVCVEQLDSHRTDFVKFNIPLFFEKPSRKLKFH